MIYYHNTTHKPDARGITCTGLISELKMSSLPERWQRMDELTLRGAFPPKWSERSERERAPSRDNSSIRVLHTCPERDEERNITKVLARAA